MSMLTLFGSIYPIFDMPNKIASLEFYYATLRKIP